MPSSAGPDIVQDGLVLELDAADRNSYVSGSATWFDLSGNTRSGSLINGPGFSSSSLGSISFDGVDDYVNLGTFTGLGNSNRTISVWFKTVYPNSSATRVITLPLDDTNIDTPAYTLGLFPNSFINVGFGGAPFDGYKAASYPSQTWVNVTTTITANTSFTAYLNGTLWLTGTNTGAVATNPIGYIGRYNSNYGQYTSASVSNVLIYNRVLTPAEVLQNYNATKTRFGL